MPWGWLLNCINILNIDGGWHFPIGENLSPLISVISPISHDDGGESVLRLGQPSPDLNNLGNPGHRQQCITDRYSGLYSN